MLKRTRHIEIAPPYENRRYLPISLRKRIAADAVLDVQLVIIRYRQHRIADPGFYTAQKPFHRPELHDIGQTVAFVPKPLFQLHPVHTIQVQNQQRLVLYSPKTAKIHRFRNNQSQPLINDQFLNNIRMLDRSIHKSAVNRILQDGIDELIG
ncbi:hypothetical protein D3C72_1830300 [compost metagenome]